MLCVGGIKIRGLLAKLGVFIKKIIFYDYDDEDDYYCCVWEE